MSQVGTPRHDPISIGEAAVPSFVKLPEPSVLFERRAWRLRTLALVSDLAPYLTFLAGICDIQHAIQNGLPPVTPPSEEAMARARTFGMPPLDRAGFVADAAFEETLARLVARAEALDMPQGARDAVTRIARMDAPARLALARAALADSPEAAALAEHLFAAAALQVHFSRLAHDLDAALIEAVRDGLCPCCGGPPVASLVVGWPGAHATRYCACALCQSLWHHVRIKCAVCGSTESISYEEIEAGPGLVKAENCGKCGCYVKIMHQLNDPELDPVADDVASLGLDLLMRDAGARRGAVNPFLVGY
ncbi:MAG: formate dehydrogenase accessory protein FdhE [Xanthobacteraceae bacterium]|nr:MAG: formate dehydrogenase accessory protein FdhE [Xanthobacteraceae bacterium]